MAMTLDEAIRHCREVAEGCPGGDRQCGYQHDQLADWLEELKAYRATGMTPERVETLGLCDLDHAVTRPCSTVRPASGQSAASLWQLRRRGKTCAGVSHGAVTEYAPSAQERSNRWEIRLSLALFARTTWWA